MKTSGKILKFSLKEQDQISLKNLSVKQQIYRLMI